MFLLGLLTLLIPLQSFADGYQTKKDVLELNSAPETLRGSSILLPRWREVHPSPFSIGGEVRFEYDRFDNFEWGSVPDDHNGFFLNRLMLHTDYKISDKSRFFADFISATVMENQNQPDPPDRDDFDIHQVFFDYRFGTTTARLGRQEMEYGAGKFVSLREGKNVRASFDGIRLISETSLGRLSTFFTRPTEVKPFGLDDRPNNDIEFWGAYLANPISEYDTVDLYYFGIHRGEARYNQGEGDEKRHTIGSRFDQKNDQYEFDIEGAYQFGSFDKTKIHAWTAAVSYYQKFKALYSPRVGLTSAIASGDKNKNDGELNTFYAMFPKGAFFGQIAQNGPSNFISLRPSLDLNFSENLATTIDLHLFWRENTHDGLYGIPGNLIRSDSNSSKRYFGSQPGFETTYTFSQNLSATVFYAHFFAAGYLKDTVEGQDIDYVGSRAVYRF